MKKIALILFILISIVPSGAFARTFQYEAWVPYWRQNGGVDEAADNLKKFNELSPFAYEVDSTGFVADKIKTNIAPWSDLISTSQAGKVKIIPTVFWGYGTQIHNVLSDPEARKNHEDLIADIVNLNGFDGIDIDYEDRQTKTRPYFSAFIKELSAKLHAKKKILACTVGPRMSNAAKGVKSQDYATEFSVLNRYCDEVRVMFYDQFQADVQLSKAKGAKGIYLPIGDIDFVRKSLKETLRWISPSKLVMGIASYGYKFQPNANGVGYKRVGSFGAYDMIAINEKYGDPVRNSAGELMQVWTDDNGVKNVAVLSDAIAINQKIQLAKAYGLRGVALFKLDGTNDPNLWQYIK